MDIGRGGDEAVDCPAFPVHTHMDLHAEIVLVPLLRGVHVGVPFLVLVLRGGGGVDDGGIHDGPFGESQSLLLEVGVDFLKDPLAEAVGLEKMAELADSGFVRDRFVSEVDPDEAPQRFHVVEGFFRPRVTEVEPALQEMDPEHPFQTYRGTAFACLWVEGFDEGVEFLPGNDPLHFCEELFPLCGFLVFLEGGGVRKRFLAVHRSSSPRMVWSFKQLLRYYFTRSKGDLLETFSEIP